MKPDDIREIVQSMWLTTPEMELLGCIALALAEILATVISGHDSVPCESREILAQR